jgi:isopenicillin N synthase-like dioxygenase
MDRHVPTLDIGRYATDRAAFIAELGAAYREFGFCCIGGHGIDTGLIDNAYRRFADFFALPLDSKMKYHLAGSGGARGYTPFKVETAKDSLYPDLKEFWHVGREIPRDCAQAQAMPPNLWPAEIPEFQKYSYELFQALDALGSRVLQGLALHIGLSEHYFADKTNFGNSILRPIHYPPITQENIPNVRAGAHEDINLITLLVGAGAEGLELLTREGTWLPITTRGDAIVVNIGDMLQRLSNHVYPSTTHRVVNPPGEKSRQPRYSVPYFLHPNPDFLIKTLPQCISSNNPDRYPQPILAHDYLMERLREIRLV